MKTKSYAITLLSLSFLITLPVSALVATSSKAISENSPFKAGTPLLSTSTEMSATGTMLLGSQPTKQEIKKIVSKLESVSDDKKKIHESSPLGFSVLFIIKSLTESSQSAEALVQKVDDLISKKSASGFDTTEASFKLETAKSNLNSANTSVTALTEMTAPWMNETSTSTFKKVAKLHKDDFKNTAENAKKNIKSTYLALHEVLKLLKPKETVAEATSSPCGLIDCNAGQASTTAKDTATTSIITNQH